MTGSEEWEVSFQDCKQYVDVHFGRRAATLRWLSVWLSDCVRVVCVVVWLCLCCWQARHLATIWKCHRAIINNYAPTFQVCAKGHIYIRTQKTSLSHLRCSKPLITLKTPMSSDPVLFLAKHFQLSRWLSVNINLLSLMTIVLKLLIWSLTSFCVVKNQA